MTTPGSQHGFPLPGGTSISHVRVYDWVGPDGLAGGSPHLHTVCTEAYLVIAGEGSVQTLSGEGFTETPLRAGSLAWFPPGVVHRLVNVDGALELFVVMSNAGLPEAGDLVLALTPDLLADPDAYQAVATLPDRARTTDGDPTAARERRDAAVRGFTHWRAEVERLGGQAGLAPLHRAAAGLVAASSGEWSALVDSDPTADLARTRRLIELLGAGDLASVAASLSDSGVRSASLLPDRRRMGCCGTLGTVVAPPRLRSWST